MKYKNKVALITGASRGIGRAIALELSKKGLKIAFNYLKNTEKALELKKIIEDNDGEAFAVQADISNFDETKKMINKVLEKYETIDILINNAGKNIDNPLLKMPLDDWQEVINTNLNGLFNVTRNCIFTMMKNKTGRIINISSISGIQGLPGQTNYSASKAGIIGFTKALAKEAAPFGIQVNVVAPSGVNTEMMDSMTDAAKQSLLSVIPMKRFCEPEEVANVVGYLATESPEYLNGSVIVLDGASGV